MSLRGRFAIDRIKRAVAGYLKMPVPPYQDPNYWEGVYKSLGPTDVFEWGNITCQDLLQYSYRPVAYEHPVNLLPAPPPNPNLASDTRIETSLGETLGVHPNGTKDEPILILGCGNSKLGEDLLANAWRGPVLQVDCSSRVVESLSVRCAAYLESGDMLVLQDDATMLSAVEDETFHSVFDKGLLDAIFCVDDYPHCFQIMKSVHRVLKPRSTFCGLSFSRPEFILPKLLLPPDAAANWKHAQMVLKLWKHVEIRQLDYIYLYRFTKAEAATPRLVRNPVGRSRR